MSPSLNKIFFLKLIEVGDLNKLGMCFYFLFLILLEVIYIVTKKCHALMNACLRPFLKLFIFNFSLLTRLFFVKSHLQYSLPSFIWNFPLVTFMVLVRLHNSHHNSFWGFDLELLVYLFLFYGCFVLFFFFFSSIRKCQTLCWW